MAKREYLKEELDLHELRLKELKKQKALRGISADPSLDIEISQIEAKVQALEQQIARLGSTSTTVPPQNPKSQPKRSGQYDLAKIRRLLGELFLEDDLRNFVLDEPDFRPIHNELREIDRRSEILRRILDYAQRRNLLSKLLDWAQRANPARYAEEEPYFR